VFIVALLIVSGLLIARVPDILPWALTPELSTLIGCMFLGAAAYFAYGVAAPRWENAGGQLAGFLAYGVVLILPFLVRPADHRRAPLAKPRGLHGCRNPQRSACDLVPGARPAHPWSGWP